MVGTGRHKSNKEMVDSIRSSEAEIITVAIGRIDLNNSDQKSILDFFDWNKYTLLPNTAGSKTAKEAIYTAELARELTGTSWIKLEVIGNTDTLQPDIFGLVEAAQLLTEEGFNVFPYCTEDLVVADRLLGAGCEVLMPWGAPIGSGMGLNNEYGLRALRSRFPNVPMVIDAGIGLPSHASRAMELGFDAVLLNTAVAKAGDPVKMALAMSQAVAAGLLSLEAEPMEPRDMASPSTPVIGQAFLS